MNVLQMPFMVTGHGEVIGHFADYQRARGFSPATIRRRTLTLTQFLRFLQPGSLFAATDSDVQEFLLMRDSARTRHAYRSDLRTFYTWACRRSLTTNDPTLLIDPIRVPKTLPRPVPAEMVRDLVRHAPTTELQLAVALAAYAGLRIAEIAALDGLDIDWQHQVLFVRAGKGNKDRAVPMHPMLAQYLKGYAGKSGRVFQVKTDTIGRSVAKYLRESGVDATAHKLRATFATELAEAARGNVVMVQRLMGHESPTTTMAYVGWGGGAASGVVSTMYDDCA